MYTRRCTSTMVPVSGGVKPQIRLASRGCRARSWLIMPHSSYGTIVFPSSAPRREHEIGILGLAERAVIAAERAVVVALLDVEVVAQDGAAVGEVRAQVEQIVIGLADHLHPERHHLHVAAGAGTRTRVLAKAALDLDHAHHELRVEPRARRLVVHRAQELEPRLAVGDPPLEAKVHRTQPAL